MLANITNLTTTASISNFKSIISPKKLGFISDSISFTGRKNANPIEKQMMDLEKSAFPSENLREFMLSELSKSNNKSTIVDLHSQYYLELQNCTALDEAKEMYPEFNDVIDAKDLDLSRLNKKNMLNRIANGEFAGLSIENLSIELLKRYYKPITVSRGNVGEYFNFDTSTTRRLLDTLNIKMDKRYSSLLGRQITLSASTSKDTVDKRAQSLRDRYSSDSKLKARIGEASKERWQQKDYREHMAQVTSSEEYKRNASETSRRLWQDKNYRAKTTQRRNEAIRTPEYRQKRQEIWQRLAQDEDFIKRFQEAHQTPEFREKISQLTTSRWQDPKAKEAMLEGMNSVSSKILSQICTLATKIAWEIHPEAKICYKKVSKKYPYMKYIVERERNNKPLTREQASYKRRYFGECAKEFPNIRKEVTAIEKELLESWGFYEKDRDPVALLAIAEYEYENCFNR